MQCAAYSMLIKEHAEYDGNMAIREHDDEIVQVG
jgi:hypothetical protein